MTDQENYLLRVCEARDFPISGIFWYLGPFKENYRTIRYLVENIDSQFIATGERLVPGSSSNPDGTKNFPIEIHQYLYIIEQYIHHGLYSVSDRT